ncbi:UPF0314 protein [Siccirubricoccus deserti]|uniref:DUF2585 family protein n=1 Tax=Siccirubricoccus deserti TaxID=2013562 RepID=A0A9X0UEY9_9PROT|nr:DUF2585 family protein [Siccirubricoccus deserti]MBC4017293.1 DUF2585 family protein [Siccirubricoccus deserti]GGC57917.1 UPF0314 protein [Siccirubricoccus deserti]
MRNAHYWILGLLLLHAAAKIELAMGRTPICRCGTIRLWQNEVLSPENSQQIADWYTLSHIVHGLIFYAALAWAAPRAALGLRALIAFAVEIAWEVTENTDWAIARYREATIALGYHGDSVLNSVSDMLTTLLGFWLAARLPVWASVVLALGLEALALAVIRDNLTLNLLMLLYPLQSILNWQAAP